MKKRIALWAAAGFFVAGGWAIYFLGATGVRPLAPAMSALVRITCPIAIAGAQYPVSLYFALLANVATYALLGLIVEALRRQMCHSK